MPQNCRSEPELHGSKVTGHLKATAFAVREEDVHEMPFLWMTPGAGLPSGGHRTAPRSAGTPHRAARVRTEPLTRSGLAHPDGSSGWRRGGPDGVRPVADRASGVP